MTNAELIKFFSFVEWYDNSRIKLIRGCKRKAFFSLIGPRGKSLAASVGDGANFGSSFHAGLSNYYNNWGKFSEPERRVFAARAFADEWSQYFPTEHIQSKHRLDNGLLILNRYCEHYLTEDSLYEPVESELGFAINMRPNIDKVWEHDNKELIHSGQIYIPKYDEPHFDSFYYVGRIDGIFRRLSDDTYWERESKTLGVTAPTALEKRLKELKFDHQPVGYTACTRILQPQYKISGFMGDVIGIASQSLGFARDYFPVKQSQCDSWRTQLISTVEDWRRRVNGWNNSDKTQYDLDHYFEQDTSRCNDYGLCSFFELCDYGSNNETLAMFEENTWNPLLQRTPAKVEIV